MEAEKYDEETSENPGREIPVHFRLMDVFLEQVEQAAPFTTNMMLDMQKVYIESVHLALKAGESMEDRSAVNIKYFKTARSNFDAFSPVITEAQLGVTRAMMDSACQGLRLMRKSITGQK
jgi:midasin (ATPase involved in ribosome maturation)